MKNSLVRWLLTLLIIGAACVFCSVRYKAYFHNPWTRDGMVQADIVEVAARLSGPVKFVHVRDNQLVQAGDPLFDLDDRVARVAVDKAEAALLRKQAQARSARDRAERDAKQHRISPRAVSSEVVQQSLDGLLSAEADVAVAQAQLAQVRLDLAFTRVVAPVAGYVINLAVQPGTMSTAFRPLMALINIDTFRVDAFFRETQIRDFRPGDRALVTLMTYSGEPLEAVVESIGRGIARSNGSTGRQLLPEVSPTFEWIRLAQRIPVRLRFERLPPDIALRVGTTASVLVRARPVDGPIAPLPTLWE